jgi:N-acetylglucosamine-6-phosphate deacetylase
MTAPPLLLRGGRLLDVDRASWRTGDLLLAHGRITGLGRVESVPERTRRVDVSGLLVAPGLVDAQVNGAAGIDLTVQPEGLPTVARALLGHGVTAFVPTVISAEPGTLRRILDAVQAMQPSSAPDSAAWQPDPLEPALPEPAARVLGVHAEGPFLAPGRGGAHPQQHLRAPGPALPADWSRAAGVVVVTLAPELPGALQAIRDLTARGVVVWIGHTEAGYGQVRAAVAAGARAVTHLFNAMPPLDHREPGPVGAVLGDGDLVAGVIVDGHHLHPAAVRAAWRALRPDRFMLVSDTTAALGMPDGPTVLGDQRVLLQGGAVRLAEAPHSLAGSGVGLDHCLRTLLRDTGCSAAQALVAATRIPARLLDRPDLGRLELGAVGDVTVWTDGLDLHGVVSDGRVLQGAAWKW